MKIGTKVILVAIGGILTTTLIGVLVQRSVIRKQSIDLTRDTMRSTLLAAENARAAAAYLTRNDAYDMAKLVAETKAASDFRNTTLYRTIPVVAAWSTVQTIAEKEKFEFRVPRANPRNLKNTPTAAESAILRFFDEEGSKSEEYFAVDEARNEIVYARPITLSQDCLSCHGDPQKSSSRDGKDLLGFAMEGKHVGDSHGAFVLRSSLGRVDEAIRAAMLKTISWMVGAVLFIGIIAFTFSRRISHALGTATDMVRRVASRDLTARVDSDSQDEAGAICRSLNEMVSNLSENVVSIGRSSRSVAAASEELNSVSSHVTSTAEQASAQAHAVAAAAEQVSANISTVATAAEQMGGTIKEIAKNAADAARIATHAVQAAEDTNQSVAKLGMSTERVGDVVKTITSIAEQTNLLALNATIEAARAGEAGKGFAVVANEVKELARQTAVATEDISQRITAIQGDSKTAVAAIERIGTIIEQISEIQTTIASAVEEQAAATNEIARNASEAAQGSSEITRNVADLSEATQITTRGSGQTLEAARELSNLASDLAAIVSQFRLDEASSDTRHVGEKASDSKMPYASPRVRDAKVSPVSTGARPPASPQVESPMVAGRSAP